MNRLKTLFFTLLLILVFTACEGNKEEDTTLPTFRPIVNKTIPFGLAFDPLEDVTAHDNIDGDITANVECIIYDSYGTEAFDVNVTDVYTQICTIRDAAGNTESTERIITVQDELIGAVISGVKDTTIGIGVYFDPMENLEIIDKLDGNITEDVVINIYNTDTPNEQVESIDTSDLGSFYIDYIIINSLDITTELRIQVDVIDETGPVITASDISHGNDVLHDLLSGVSANDEFYGPISEITYTIYDSSNNVVEYTDYIYGEFTIVYEAVDPSGNVGTKEVSFELLDYYPPHISFFNGNLIIFPGDTINLEDNLSYYDESDDTLIISYEITNLLTSTIVTDLTETDFGYYIVVAEATDKSGVSAQIYFYLTITTGDMVTLDSPIYNAEVILTDFYGYIIAGFRTIEEVCEIYVTDVPFEVNMSYEECISGVSDFKTKVSERSLINTTIEVIDGITYYTTEVEFFRPDENVIKEITYHLVSYEHSLKVYIVFDSDPFDVEYPISVYNPQFEMVDDSLATFYNNMLSSTSLTPTQFCEDFVVNTVYNTMTLNECVEYVEAVNSSILQYYIVSYEAITIPFGDGPDLNGYEAVIDVSRTSLSQIVTVQFIFFRQGDNESISFIDGFFSSDFMYDLKFAHGTPLEREQEITEFYDALLNASLSSSIFCETQIMISPIYDYELDRCISYVEDIRTHGVTYTINDITPNVFEAFNGTLYAYTLDITFIDGGIDQNLLIDFVMLHKSDGYYPIFFDLYLVNLNYEEELNHAVLGFRSYPGIIQGFYDDVLDTAMSDTDFCSKYLLTGGVENLPLTNQECSGIRIDLFKGTYSFTVEEIIYQDIGDPQYPPVYSVDMLQNAFRDYKVEFTMYYNPLGELIIKVNLNDALGGGFE